MIDAGLYIGYLLLAVATISAVVFPLINSIKNPKAFVMSAIAVGGLVVIFLVAYGMAGGELTPKYQALGVTTESSSKLIGAGLILFYIVFVLAVIGMIYSEINKALK